ncbi:MAG: type IV conjugative transfer system lipoprotein TraV [Gammaproteobacteria bacterium]|nr:type IV conjugative transfer system lipoprotein TraV [Gammaproteobacteria bacterium]
MIKQVSKLFYLTACFALLSGCGNQNFDCPYKDGVRCMRLSEVDKQISAGKLGSDTQNHSKSSKASIKLTPLQPVFFVPEGSPLRSQEEVLSIWMAPYQSIDGTYHEQNVLHFVAKEAAWAAPHARVENLEEQGDDAKS